MGSPGRKKDVSDMEILRAIQTIPGPAFLTSELADRIGLSRQGTSRRLHDLEEEGLLATKKAGGRRLWWLTYDGERRLAEDSS
ncbi:hypothetical protein GCM10009066_09450 [Halarchaeum salinum]|uniref:HTH marR-type domain-containing protein n=2 Tax=Halarchaeum salinum TaxID=489912 RepID=A0AAV3S6B9_9EURY